MENTNKKGDNHMISISDIKDIMIKVNDYHIKKYPDSGDCSWERGAYFLGCLAAYDVTQKKEYYEYALKWANDNNWDFYDDKSDWAWKNADYKICGQSYLRLMEIDPTKGTMDNMKEKMEVVLNDDNIDYWWWIDTIYMALPFYNMMGIKLSDNRYFHKAYALFEDTKSNRQCYDTDEKMWFRDIRFFPKEAKTISGKKVFWSRGNGWVLGGLARTLEILPMTNKYYSRYLEVFKDMIEALLPWQQADGFWRTSIIEPDEFPMPETSGTVLIAYAIMVGINIGILNNSYFKYVQKSFEGMNNISVFPNGKIGWVQVVADRPGPVDKNAENDYAVGTYLLLCREIIKFMEKSSM